MNPLAVCVPVQVWKYTDDKRFKSPGNKFKHYLVCKSIFEHEQAQICKSRIRFVRKGGCILSVTNNVSSKKNRVTTFELAGGILTLLMNKAAHFYYTFK